MAGKARLKYFKSSAHLSFFAVLILVVMAFFLRWHYASRTLVYPYDSYYYLVLGRQLYHGFGYSVRGLPHFKFQPFYPLVIAFGTLFLRNVEFTGKMASVLFHSLTVIPIFAIGKRCFSRSAGLLAALFFTLEPISVAESVLPMSEGVYVFLVCVSLYFFLRWFEGDGEKYLMWSALFGGLCPVTRWEGFLLLFIYAPAVFHGLWKKSISMKKMAIFAGVFLIPSAIWFARNLIVFGNPFRSSYFHEFFAHSKGMEMYPYWERLRRYLIFSDYDPGRYTSMYYNYGLLVAGYFGFLLMGLQKKYRRLLMVFPLWLILLGPFHFLWWFTSTRFLIAAVPALCLGAGLTFQRLFEATSSRALPKPFRLAAKISVVAMVALVCFLSIPVFRDKYSRESAGLYNLEGAGAAREAFIWMKSNLPAGVRVASNTGPLATFYLERDVLFLGPFMDFDYSDIDMADPLNSLRENQVDYLVIYSFSPSLESAFQLARLPLQLRYQLELVRDFEAQINTRDAPPCYAFVLRINYLKIPQG